jgi:predicted small secreted protein
MKTLTIRRRATATVLSLCLLASAAAMLSACNTTAGAGQDVSAVGHAVTGSADTVKSSM